METHESGTSVHGQDFILTMKVRELSGRWGLQDFIIKKQRV
jgi:hypothetical protein